MELEVYIKEIGKGKLDINNPRASAFIHPVQSNSLEETISKKIKGIDIRCLFHEKKTKRVFGMDCGIPIGFKITGNGFNPSEIYQIITSNGYSIVDSKINLINK